MPHRQLLRLLPALVVAAALPAGAAQDPVAAKEVLVKLASTTSLPGVLARYPVVLLRSLGPRPIYRLKVVGGAGLSAVIRDLRGDPDVQVAEPNRLHQSPEARKNVAWAIGTETEYRAQWAPQAMRLPEAQQLADGAGVRVAVLDTGIDAAHPALAGRVLPGRDFVDGDNDPSERGSAADPAWGHGTHVAGLVALTAPAASILPARVLRPDGSGDMWSVAEAILWALDPDGNPETDDGAHVINLSLGSVSRTRLYETLSTIASCNLPRPVPTRDLSDPGYDADKRRCDLRAGVVIVAAAGNDASDTVKQYPAAENEYGLLPVAASDAQRHIATFSNSGGWIEVAAPGDGITSALPGGLWGTWSGTSMAAPLASGTAALLRGRDFAAAPKALVRTLERASASLCGTADQRQIDALAALTGTPLDLPCP
jgi:subtilisin family serine protease